MSSRLSYWLCLLQQVGILSNRLSDWQGIGVSIIRGTGRQTVGAVILFISYYVIALPVGISLMFATSLHMTGSQLLMLSDTRVMCTWTTESRYCENAHPSLIFVYNTCFVCMHLFGCSWECTLNLGNMNYIFKNLFAYGKKYVYTVRIL